VVVRCERRGASHEDALFRFVIRRLLIGFCAFAGLAVGVPSPGVAAVECPADHIDEYVEVADVHDGDTVRLADGRKLRLIGFNSPELARDEMPAEPLATEARDALLEIIGLHARLGLRYDEVRKDRYRRLLAHAYLRSGQSIAARMLEGGYGVQIVVPPDLWNHDCYRAAESSARAAGTGVWSLSRYAKPTAAARLKAADRAFHLVSGRITRIGTSRASVWLDLDDRLAVRIARSDLHYFQDLDLDGLKGRTVVVRGWVFPYRGRPMMQIRFPYALEIAASD
jgi:micrococcal nuclease